MATRVAAVEVVEGGDDSFQKLHQAELYKGPSLSEQKPKILLSSSKIPVSETPLSALSDVSLPFSRQAYRPFIQSILFPQSFCQLERYTCQVRAQ